jgi:nucleotide-binding universal stress UspA family protein
VASWLLGSTSRSLLEQTQTPLLMIPDNDFDIVSVGDTRATLHFGSVIAAVDRAASNRGQLTLASELAKVSGQPLTFLTVIEPGDATTLAEAEEDLRDRAHGLTPVRPHSLIVRRGNVAKEIVACCDAERAGVVVMGLRAKARGNRPGAIATAVLAHGSSAVLAVTDSP